MSLKLVPIGLYAQETKSVIGFEGFKKEYENNIQGGKHGILESWNPGILWNLVESNGIL